MIVNSGRYLRLVGILLFVATSVRSQKIYTFDYSLEFTTDSLYQDNATSRHLFQATKNYRAETLWVNSRDNSYHMMATFRTTDSLSIRFCDNAGISAFTLNTIGDFGGSSNHHFDCRFLRRYRGARKSYYKHYEFRILSDTIIKGKEFGRYTLVPRDAKYARRKKAGVQYFIVDKTIDAEPIMLFANGYQILHGSVRLPRGLLYQMYFIDFKGILMRRQTLTKIDHSPKKVEINKECFDKKGRLIEKPPYTITVM